MPLFNLDRRANVSSQRRFARTWASFTAVLAATILAATTACGPSSSPTVRSPQSEAVDEQGSTLTVFAAASLQGAFTQIAQEVFSADHPQVDVVFSFEGSSTLVEQIINGASADVFASADTRNMDKAIEADVVASAQVFTRNVLALIVPAGNPAAVTGLDSSLEGINLVVCAPQVPCGNLTMLAAQSRGIELHPVSQEQKVTDVRSKVESGQADAGFVYATDAANRPGVQRVELPDAPSTDYPIAVVKDSAHPQLAQAFISAVLSPAGQAVLSRYGFQSVTR